MLTMGVVQPGERLFATVSSASLQLENRKTFDPKATVKYHIDVVVGGRKWVYVFACHRVCSEVGLLAHLYSVGVQC